MRNTHTHRLCPACQGAGEVMVNHSGFYASGRQDPQCDEPAPCPEIRCEQGWVRWAPVDPLEKLAYSRRFYLRGHRAPTLGQQYREARIRAFRPVRLPDFDFGSRAEVLARFDTAAAIANFRGLDATFHSLFGTPLLAKGAA